MRRRRIVTLCYFLLRRSLTMRTTTGMANRTIMSSIFSRTKLVKVVKPDTPPVEDVDVSPVSGVENAAIREALLNEVHEDPELLPSILKRASNPFETSIFRSILEMKIFDPSPSVLPSIPDVPGIGYRLSYSTATGGRINDSASVTLIL